MQHSSFIVRFPAFVAVIAALFALAFIGDNGKKPFIFLPGTEPGQADTSAAISQCKSCHLKQYNEWSGSMMAHAPKDPLFNSMLCITEKYMMGRGLDVGEYCLRCHAPSAWLAGRSHPQTTEGMYGTDLDGVHCDVCHRMTNPMANDGSAIIGDTVPGYGDGMYAVQRYQQPIRGTRGVAHPYANTYVDMFLKTSEYCGVCHEVSNPYLTPNARHIPPFLQTAMERTFSEWQLSWYAGLGEGGTCQSCHMKRSEGRAANVPGAPLRLDVASHAFMGGNTFSGRSVLHQWNGVDTAAIETGYKNEQEILHEGVRVEVSAGKSHDSVRAVVRLTNLTGHKLPTGFPEGRRMWIQLTGKNKFGSIVFQSGEYDTSQHELIEDPQVKIYRTEPGVSQTLAVSLGISAGPSFFSPLNDTVYFDNRIPPRGFQEAPFSQHHAEPTGYHYDDGQYWDETAYMAPSTVESVEVKVWFQVVSKSFIQFARDENQDNPYDWNSWGEKVYADWLQFGQPVEMAETKSGVSDSFSMLPIHQDNEIPVQLRLAQNYPNPFNPQTTIEFWISLQTFVSLSVFDLSGKCIEQLINGNCTAGLHIVTFNAGSYPSGVYIYRVQTGALSVNKKMVIIK